MARSTRRSERHTQSSSRGNSKVEPVMSWSY
jgi:hypothetical protein